MTTQVTQTLIGGVWREEWLQGTPTNRAGFFAIVRALIPFESIEMIDAAYRMAKEAHRKDKRDDGSRYFNHPRRVALILMLELGIKNWEDIVIALLHDVREDSYMLQAWAIKRLFGENVLRSLGLLTKEPREGYLARLQALGTTRDWISKLADRLDNVRTLGGCTPEKRQKQVKETVAHYLPLADMLSEKLPSEEKWRGVYLREQIVQACNRWTTPDDSQTIPKQPSPETPPEVVNDIPISKLLIPSDELELSVRTANCLKNAELKYVGDIVTRKFTDLLKTKRFGRKSLQELEGILHEMDLALGLRFSDELAKKWQAARAAFRRHTSNDRAVELLRRS